ncbi:NAD(P)-binding protein [Xylariaceae sp. FL0594]|nr:NAD(P)-binding protein [Xylariaceae sp. FL0594]
MDISGNTLVFGGGSGIGRACALALSRCGAACITIADINLDSAQRVADECRGVAAASSFQSDACVSDVTSEESVNETLVRATRLFGRVDHVVNSAGLGISTTREIAEADTIEFKRLLDVNVTGTFLVLKCVSAVMRTQEPRPNDPSSPDRGSTRGTIVTLGSASSFASTPNMAQYTTSKFAVLGLTKNSALDNAAHGIRVNCVCPSWVQTPMVKQAIDTVPGLGAQIDSAVPLGRIAQPEEVADAVTFLLSSRSSYVTGCGFIIDGAHGFISHGFPAPGLKRTVRHITGHDADGKATFLSTDCGDHHLIMGEQQALSNILYSTHQTPVNINGDVDIRHAKENVPPLHYLHGTVLRMIDFAPNELTPLHRALSIDYGVVMEGEFELILESGERKLMRQGDVCIQRATAHQWRNVTGGGTLPGRMLWVLLGVEDVIVKEKKLEGFMGPLAIYYPDQEK